MRYRARDIVTFVALVWAVAGSFVLFDVVMLRGMDVALAHPLLFQSVLLSTATKTSTTCEVDANTTPAYPVGSQDWRVVRAAAWTLGQQVGRDAQAAMSSTVTPETLAASAQAINTFATSLSVPVPSRFQPVNIVNSNTEFVQVLEAGADGTAHALAQRYGADACQLYKLGALWGYAAVARFSLPGERNIYSSEISYYASRLELPNELWQPFVARTRRDAPAAEIMQATLAQSQTLTNYLIGPRPTQ
ncbi:MAG: hypothetical protein JSU08_19220 [Acidobacteria bacterium]|nr:hypothetical protein [Acidobacteriota bacterium]